MNRFCECNVDGYCARYNRIMSGRMREICAGINCDLGTAAAFRDTWTRETKLQHARGTETRPLDLLLKTDQAPGDAVAMTAAIYSLHKAHPNAFRTAVESPYPDVFAYNPAIVPHERIPDALPLHMHYPAIHDSNQRAIHFMQGWCEFLSMALGITVPLLTNRPHIYFPDPTPSVEDYWVICSGGKNDLTNKLWGYDRYQHVVNILKDRIRFVQVGATDINHPKLYGVEDIVGKTTLRQLFDVVRRARGVLCGVSLLMHVAAALEKPAVVIAGGREPVAWNAYPHQHYLHTIGMLPCYDATKRTGGCWRSRTLPLGDNPLLDADPCLFPQGGLAGCMSLIQPHEVAMLILRYNKVV